jgi:hypothetical protein
MAPLRLEASLKKNEKIIYKARVVLVTKLFFPKGVLYLTNQRLHFAPTLFDRLFYAKKGIDVPLTEIKSIKKVRKHCGFKMHDGIFLEYDGRNLTILFTHGIIDWVEKIKEQINS